MISKITIQKPTLIILERASFQRKNGVPLFFIGDYELTFEDVCEDFSDCVNALTDKIFINARSVFLKYMQYNYIDDGEISETELHNCSLVFNLIVKWFSLQQFIGNNHIYIENETVPKYFQYILQALFKNAQTMHFYIDKKLKNYIED